MKWIQRSIRAKLLAVSSIILLLFGVVAVGTMYWKVKESNYASMDQELVSVVTTLAKQVDVDTIKQLFSDPSNDNKTVVALSKNFADLTNTVQKYAPHTNISSIYITYRTEQGKTIITAMGSIANTTTYVNGTPYVEEGDFKTAMDAIMSGAQFASTDAYVDDYGSWKSGFAPIIDRDGKIIAALSMDFDVSQTAAKVNRDALFMVGAVVLFLVISNLVLFFYLTRITRPIEALSNCVEQMSGGDLAVEPLALQSHDEVAVLTRGFNTMAQRFRDIIHQLQNQSHDMATSADSLAASSEQSSQASQQIMEAVQQVANGSEVQVMAVGESGEYVDDISSGMGEILVAVQTVNEKSQTASSRAIDGRVKATEVVEQMNVVRETTETTAKVVEQLEAKSTRIGEIVSLMGEIADQTNLLALNAAIEAARAGEHGKGFAVVASEVRKLAEQSANAASHIRELIGEIQTETNEAVVAMRAGSKAVHDGTHIVQQTESSFEQIVATIQEVLQEAQRVTPIVSNVKHVTGDMVGSFGRIRDISVHSSSNTQSIAAAVQQQSASMQEIASSAITLSQMSDQLRAISAQFKLQR